MHATMHGRILPAALPALLMATLSAAGCGDDGETSAGSTDAATSATSLTSATSATAATGATTSASGGGSSSGGGGSSGPATTSGDPTSGGDPTEGGTSTGGDPGDGFLRVDPAHPAWLQVDGVGPFFICGPGDPEDFLHRGALLPDGTRDGDQAAIIAKLAPTGANAMYVQAIRSHGGDGDATHNPFVDHDPSKGLNEAVLDQWSGWLHALSDAGVATFFFIYDDSAQIWKTGDQVGAEEAAFVGALVDRLEDVPLLVWVIAEEYGEVLAPARVSALAALIRERDDHGHAIAVHQNSGLVFDFPADPNIDHFAIQYNVGSPAELHGGLVQAFTAASGAYGISMAEAAGWGSGADHRMKSWAAATAGAYVLVLGMDVVSTPSADLAACGHLVDHFRATPSFVNMAPHDELALTATTVVFADPGRSYMVYSPGADSLGVSGLVPGTHALRWLDAASGATHEEIVEVAGAEAIWPRPDGLGAEVALAIVRQG